MNPSASATEILKTITSTNIGMFLSGQCRKVARAKVTGPFLRSDFGERELPRVLTKVENAVTVEPVGEFALKGIRRPMMAYNVLEASTSKMN